MEVKPCNGKKPLMNRLNGRELDCGHGPERQDCPPNSYCHQTPTFAKCCNKSDLGIIHYEIIYLTLIMVYNEIIIFRLNLDAAIVADDCQNSSYGCCPDKKTSAKGPKHLDCPVSCNCNKLGEHYTVLKINMVKFG